MNTDPLLQRLREEDPARVYGVLEPSLARIEAQIGTTLSADENAALRRPNRMSIGISAAAAVVVAVIALGGVIGGGLGIGSWPPVAAVSERPRLPGNDLTSCAFDPATDLGEREYVFYGTVEKVTATDVEFAVEEWLRGPGGPRITLRLSPGYGGGGQLMDEGVPLLAQGTRWRVAGDDGFIWGCDFTIPANSQ